MTTTVVPIAIDLRPERLQVRWADRVSELCAAELRAACRCGGCRAVSLRGDRATPAPHVRLTGAVPVGQYAVQLLFSDGHDRGIYPWQWLRELSGLKAERAAMN